VTSLLQDVIFSLRTLRRQPGFTATALITLALGIGATATMFTFANGMLLRPLPYADAERLVNLEHISARGMLLNADYPSYLDWRARSESFSAMAAYHDSSFNVSTEAEPVRVSGLNTTGELFQVLGVEAMLGRTLQLADDAPGAAPVVLISHGLWERSFARDPDLLGRDIRLHGSPHTVIGVMPPDFGYPEYADLWVAARVDPSEMQRGELYWDVVARLRDDATLTVARAELAAIGAAIAAEHPREAGGSSVTATPLRDNLVGDSGTTVLLFLGVVVFVQMIATVNVSNLLLARASTRRKEVAIRAALGASRGRIVRWLMTESLLLAAVGGLFGLMLGIKGRDLILTAIPIDTPRWSDFGFDYRVGLFIAGLAALTGVVFGLLPALYASRDLNESIKHGGDGQSSAPRQRLRGALVVAEVALALILLIGAGLMMKGLANFRSIDPGLESDGVLTLRLAVPSAQYPDAEQRRAFHDEVRGRVAAVAGVDAVAAIEWLPYANSGSTTFVMPEGFELPSPDSQPPSVLYNSASEGYFQLMGIPVLRGRTFERADAAADGAAVAVVNRFAAERFWPDENAVGKRLKFGRPDDDSAWVTVVGVVDNVRHWNLSNGVWPTVYLSAGRQAPRSTFLVVGSAGELLDLVAPIREAVASVDPELPLYGVRTMGRVLQESSWQPVVFSAMFGVFATLALSLAAVGLYGVISFSVGRRTHEMGIRRALGAVAGDVLGLVLRDALRLVGIGVAVGLVAAVGLMGLMSSILHGVDARDPVVYAVVTLVLVAVALVAAWVPGRRAARIDPAAALRSE